MELALNVIKSSLERRKSTCGTVKITSDHLTKVCDDVNLIFFLVYGKRFDWVWWSNMSWFVSYVKNTFVSVPFKWCTVVYSRTAINPKTILLSNQKALLKCRHLLNRFSHRGVKDKSSILTIIIAHNHFSVIRTNQNVACFLWPSVTSKSIWDFATLLYVVNLSVSSGYNMVLVLF